MKNYLQEIALYYKDTNSSEHSYRTSFENYLKEVFPAKDGYFTQQDQKAINGNKPDFVILKNKIPALYIEVKKVGEDLDKIEKSNQADRYFGYDNLIISDYVDFRFFRNGQKHSESINLGHIDKKNRTIEITENCKPIESLSRAFVDFTLSHKEPIKSGNQLARIMGGKAQRIRDNVVYMLQSDSQPYEELTRIQKVVEENLIHGLSHDDFADMYAQTLVYGLFAARYNDNSLETFSRAEARDLVPKTNPFLASFFDHIAGASFPERLRFIVDELCEVFSHADVHKLLTDFYGKEKDTKDPIIHFYEDFLREYDAKKKMDMGVFYTPRPVVDFIIRSVDELLKTEFQIPKGLSDTEKISIQEKEIDKRTGKEIKVSKEFHRVQILDIATGTGTFLNQAIEHIYKGFAGQEGRWNSYVIENLLPRLHGFELMMASYTIAHLKLGMTLYDSGATDLNERLGIYLTNTLDEPINYERQGSLFGFMDSIALESKTASQIKSEYPIMCVIGNPPYSGESMNPQYTDNDVYKVEPGGKEKLKERNPKWINDDYVKFIRFAESLIEKNGEGIIGMITSHGYIDNPTFRGMRWHLRKTFDKIYVVDLHGNSRKKELAPDGSKDENIFDIMTGVSIVFGVKTNRKKENELAKIYKLDLYGLRRDKFETLDNENFETIEWKELLNQTDLWILQGVGKPEYDKGFSVAKLFKNNSAGVITGKDKYLVSNSKNILSKNILELSDGEMENELVQEYFYRIFDKQYIYYDTKLVTRPRYEIMKNFVDRKNLGIAFERAISFNGVVTTFISDTVIDGHFTGGLSYIAPLYLYTSENEKIPNLDKEIWNKINETVGETTPENILDYIYAVLHSPTYRDKYKEFLKTDFPRVPYPAEKETFWKLVLIGEKLRGLHLMTDTSVNDYITSYPVGGEDIVQKISYINGSVYINAEQYFGSVPDSAWNFYIGGYQPAQKYLKDRKGRKLSNDEIEQYQRIIKVLVETDKIMKEIELRI